MSGIYFNHESPRRGFEFVSGKVTNTVAKIKLGLAKELALGNLDARRDWGYAADYVKAMWLMLQQKEPEDYVIATCESHSVTELVETAFRCAGLDWKEYMSIDRRLYRPAEIYELRGDPAKAKRKLGWQATETFEIYLVCLEPDFRETKFVIVDVGESKAPDGMWSEPPGAGQIFDSNGTLLQTRLVLNPDFESYSLGYDTTLGFCDRHG